jgi:hypothetical protein
MAALSDLITQRCDEARRVIADAWSTQDLAAAMVLVTQVELLALQAVGALQLPDMSSTPAQAVEGAA